MQAKQTNKQKQLLLNNDNHADDFSHGEGKYSSRVKLAGEEANVKNGGEPEMLNCVAKVVPSSLVSLAPLFRQCSVLACLFIIQLMLRCNVCMHSSIIILTPNCPPPPHSFFAFHSHRIVCHRSAENYSMHAIQPTQPQKKYFTHIAIRTSILLVSCLVVHLSSSIPRSVLHVLFNQCC